jgi:ribokinase
MTARVVVVGSLNMDLVIRSTRMPRAGETILGGDFHMVPGGKGANQAVAASRLGARVSMVGRVGDDAFGRELLRNLAADGIDHTFVHNDATSATGVALIVVDDAGQNSIVVASGANMDLSPSDVDGAAATLRSTDVLLLQLESPLETVVHAAELAHAHGVTVILNPAPARPLPEKLLALVDVLVPNESESALLTGMPVDNVDQAAAASAELRRAGVGTVILTLGERGALLAEQTGTRVFPAFEVEPVDTTAAGDAFLAGLAVTLAEGKRLDEAVQWANAAGALATTKLGAQTSLPTRQAVERLLADPKAPSQGDTP